MRSGADTQTHFTAHTTISEIIAGVPAVPARPGLIDRTAGSTTATELFASPGLRRAIELQAYFDLDIWLLDQGGVVPNLARLKLFWLHSMMSGRCLFPAEDAYAALNTNRKASDLVFRKCPHLLDEPPFLLPSPPAAHRKGVRR